MIADTFAPPAQSLSTALNDFIRSAPSTWQGEYKSGVTEKHVPAMTIRNERSARWASAGLIGFRYDFTVQIIGLEAEVLALANRTEADMCELSYFGDAAILVDVVRLDTDLLLDGDGHAACEMRFVAFCIDE